MNHLTKLFILMMLCLFAVPAIGQDAATEAIQPSLDNGTIESQFDYMMESSNRYQDFRVVKRTSLLKMKSNIADSLLVVRNDLNESGKIVEKQKGEINNLKSSLEQSNNQLANVQKEKNSVQFFGILLEKTVYKGIMWAIIGVLLASLLYFVYMFRKSNTVTTDTKMTLIKIQEEYESYKRKALEKQQQLKRELQDELNKQL